MAPHYLAIRRRPLFKPRIKISPHEHQLLIPHGPQIVRPHDHLSILIPALLPRHDLGIQREEQAPLAQPRQRLAGPPLSPGAGATAPRAALALGAREHGVGARVDDAREHGLGEEDGGAAVVLARVEERAGEEVAAELLGLEERLFRVRVRGGDVGRLGWGGVGRGAGGFGFGDGVEELGGPVLGQRWEERTGLLRKRGGGRRTILRTGRGTARST